MSRAALDDLIPQRIPKLLVDRGIEALTLPAYSCSSVQLWMMEGEGVRACLRLTSPRGRLCS